MVQMLMYLLFGSIDPFQSGPLKREQKGGVQDLLLTAQMEQTERVTCFLFPVFILAARCPIQCFLLLFFNTKGDMRVIFCEC